MAQGVTELEQKDRKYLIHPMHHPSRHEDPHIWVKGEGVMIEDHKGRRYIDALSALWNVNAGHGRKELAQAAYDQMSDLAYHSNYSGSANKPAIALAEKVAELSFPDLNSVFFACGGAEANDTAFKMARFYWKAVGKPEKHKIVSRWMSYHGNAMGATSATGQPQFWRMFEPRMPGFHHINAPDTYRFQGRILPGETIGQAAARELEELILHEGPDTMAAVLFEPIQAPLIAVPPDDYFPRIREICDKYDLLQMSDEVICGCGRTGKWWALENWSVQPDVITFAKGITSGYLPLAGVVVHDKIKQAMDTVPPDKGFNHGYTYSGHPACCAVGLENIKIFERENLVENSAAMGKKLRAGLDQLQKDIDIVGCVRSLGLLAGINLVKDRETKEFFDDGPAVDLDIAREMEKAGIFVLRVTNGLLPFCPPLCINAEQIDALINGTGEALKAIQKKYC